MYTYIHTCTHTHTHIYIYIYIYITYIYTYTYMHSVILEQNGTLKSKLKVVLNYIIHCHSPGIRLLIPHT